MANRVKSVDYQHSVPGLGERAGFWPKRFGHCVNGLVTKVEFTRRGIWVTFRVSKEWGLRKQYHRVKRESLTGWTVEKQWIELHRIEDKR